jgi:endoglucanase
MRWLACLGYGLTSALLSMACFSGTNDATADAGGSGGNDGSAGKEGGTGTTPIDGSNDSIDGPAADSAKTTPSEAGADGGPVTSLPALSVQGNVIKDSAGNTVVLRGVAIPDIGVLDTNAAGPLGVSNRINEILTSSMQAVDAHVVRMPVYPETEFNDGQPVYSPEPFPVGTPAPAGTTVKLLSATDYINNVLKPAVDYATSRNLYVIIDFHQIDNVVTGTNTSSADAVSFWTQVAPVFKTYPNVIYEAFNEPIDASLNGWTAAFQAAAQSWVTAIRVTAGAPNIIIVGSPTWSQHPEGAVTYPLTGGNLVYTAHTYPGNYPGNANAFQDNITTAVAAVPVFISEWGYEIGATSPFMELDTPDDTWATAFQTFVNGNGASWTAWVADPSWGPPMFTTGGGLTDFGVFVQTWLATDSASAAP